MRPSFLAHIINGTLALIGTILFIVNYKKLDISMIILFILILSIAWGVHGLMHHYEEIYYDFNPLIGKLKFYDEPIRI
jgi:hypothetical protein